MTFDRFTRRTHLYAGLFLLPWLFMYGVTSYPMNHAPFFDDLYKDGVAEWTEEPARDYHIEIPPKAELRPVAGQILKDAGVSAKKFGVFWRAPGELLVYAGGFKAPVEVIYFQEKDRMVVRHKRLRWDHVLSGFHATGGFDQENPIYDAWAVVIDVVMAAVLIWVASGIYMWWNIRHMRWWGALALGGGVVSMAVFFAVL
jgi:hypothetical protein